MSVDGMPPMSSREEHGFSLRTKRLIVEALSVVTVGGSLI